MIQNFRVAQTPGAEHIAKEFGYHSLAPHTGDGA
jgi:hypothetical protein